MSYGHTFTKHKIEIYDLRTLFVNLLPSFVQQRLEEIQRALHEADGSKRKLMVENCDLQHHQEEAERMSAQLSKDKTSLSTQLEDAKRLADAETRVPNAYANVNLAYDPL